jgi:succinate dehydrogenase/fumarate reductase cytochrome b subunit
LEEISNRLASYLDHYENALELHGRWDKVQVISGAVFLWFIIEHLIAMVLARWIDGLDTDFYWPASVMSSAPFVWYFTPYYFLGVVGLFVHLGCGLRLYLIRTGRKAMAGTAFWGISVTGIVPALLINAMLSGAFYEIRLPQDWIGYLQQFVPTYRQPE